MFVGIRAVSLCRDRPAHVYLLLSRTAQLGPRLLYELWWGVSPWQGQTSFCSLVTITRPQEVRVGCVSGEAVRLCAVDVGR